jgi:hypothetical protein
MKTVIAYKLEHAVRLKDKELRKMAATRHYPLWVYFKEGDTRLDSFPRELYVPELEVTEELKKRFQTAFAEVGLPVMFVPV